jgi:uncharacterized protein (TIGR02147 family)
MSPETPKSLPKSPPKSGVSTREILRDILARKANRNPSFSLRAFARDLGVSHTYLSLVLNGKKLLSMGKVIQFSTLLGLDEREADIFVKAGAREARGKAFERAGAKQKPGARSRRVAESYFELELDRLRLLSDWYHIPLLELTLTNDFEMDPKWIGKRLGISGQQVTDAIDRLKRLGLLEERSGRVTKAQAFLSVQPAKSEKPVRDFHRQMILKAVDAIASPQGESYEARDVTGSTMAVDPRLMPEAKRRIQAFRRSLIRFLTSGEPTEVYQLNVQLFPLSVRPRAANSGQVVKKGMK